VIMMKIKVAFDALATGPGLRPAPPLPACTPMSLIAVRF
jgi:hypothetical protein